MWGDRFVVRDQSASRTLGGGLVLDPYAPGRDRTKPWRAADRRAHENDDAGEALRALAALHPEGYLASALFPGRNLSLEEWFAAVELASDNLALTGLDSDPVVVTRERWDELRANVLHALEQFHQTHAQMKGIASASLKNHIPTRVLPQLLSNVVSDCDSRYSSEI